MRHHLLLELGVGLGISPVGIRTRSLNVSRDCVSIGGWELEGNRRWSERSLLLILVIVVRLGLLPLLWLGSPRRLVLLVAVVVEVIGLFVLVEEDRVSL